jgi:chorismate mutase
MAKKITTNLVVDRRLKPLRNKIDIINVELLRLLNKRVSVAEQIGKIKSNIGAPVSDAAREKMIIDALLEKNSGPMDELAVKRIFGTIIKETKRIERIAHSESKSAPGKKA